MRMYPIFAWLFEGALGSSVLIGLILLARRFLRNALGNRLVYALWLLVVLRLLVPLKLPSLWNVQTETADSPISVVRVAEKTAVEAKQTISDQIAYAALEQPYEAITPLHMAAYDAMQPNYSGYFWGGCYGLGVLLVGGWMTAQNLRFQRALKRRSLGGLEGEERERFDALAKVLHVRAPKTRVIDPLDSACLVGSFAPWVALPIEGCNDRYVQLHELSHLKNGDELWSVLRNVCCALFWFHPLVWLAAHVSRVDCELACDERVVQALDDRERIAYADLLVRLAACRRTPRTGVLATGMSMTGLRMKQRVTQILANKRLQRWVLVVSVMVSATLLATSFATETVYPSLNASSEQDMSATEADAWLSRDLSEYFPDDEQNAERRNTAESKNNNHQFFEAQRWTEDDATAVASLPNEQCMLFRQSDGSSHDAIVSSPVNDGVMRADYAVYDDAVREAAMRAYVTCYGYYDADGKLVALLRKPLVSAYEESVWRRSQGESLNEQEDNARRAECFAAFEAYWREIGDDAEEAVRSVQALAGQIGISDGEVLSQASFFHGNRNDVLALQLVRLRSAARDQTLTFAVEIGSWRVVAIAMSDAFEQGLRQWAAEEQPTDEQPSALVADSDAIGQIAIEAMQSYFGYTPEGVTISPTKWGYEDSLWWEVNADDADSNLRYRVEVNDDGSVRRATKIISHYAFDEAWDTGVESPDLQRYAERFGLTAKTVFWCEGGAWTTQSKQEPQELMRAREAAQAYQSAHGLDFGAVEEWRLTAATYRVDEREFDVGFLFSYANGRALFYSTIQKEIACVDYAAEDSTIG